MDTDGSTDVSENIVYDDDRGTCSTLNINFTNEIVRMMEVDLPPLAFQMKIRLLPTGVKETDEIHNNYGKIKLPAEKYPAMSRSTNPKQALFLLCVSISNFRKLHFTLLNLYLNDKRISFFHGNGEFVCLLLLRNKIGCTDVYICKIYLLSSLGNQLTSNHDQDENKGKNINSLSFQNLNTCKESDNESDIIDNCLEKSTKDAIIHEESDSIPQIAELLDSQVEGNASDRIDHSEGLKETRNTGQLTCKESDKDLDTMDNDCLERNIIHKESDSESQIFELLDSQVEGNASHRIDHLKGNVDTCKHDKSKVLLKGKYEEFLPSQNELSSKASSSCDTKSELSLDFKKSQKSSSKNLFLNSDFMRIRTEVLAYPFFEEDKRNWLHRFLKHESLRLWTFQMAPNPAHAYSRLTELAAAGFYNSGEHGEVTCFSCDKVYGNFLAGIPLPNAHGPQCEWQDANKPLAVWTEGISVNELKEFQEYYKSARARLERLRPQDTFSTASVVVTSSAAYTATDAVPDAMPLWMPDSQAVSSSSFDASDKDYCDGPQDRETYSDGASALPTSAIPPKQRLGVQEASSGSSRLMLTSVANAGPQDLSHGVSGAATANALSNSYDLSGASYPQFANRAMRLDTFRYWDSNHSQKPKELIDLGFFFTGESDCARCFYCGLGLKYWRPNDNAAYQHARFRPFCRYSIMVKGQAFVDQVQREVNQQTRGSTASANVQPDATAVVTNVNTVVESTAAQKAISEGWSKEYVREAAIKLIRDSGSDAANPTYPVFLTFLNGVKAEKDSQSTQQSGQAEGLAAGKDEADSAKSYEPLDDSEKIRLAEVENAYLKDKMYCMICKVKRIGCVFLPCGHVVACQDCGDLATTCCRCNKHIAALANIYMS